MKYNNYHSKVILITGASSGIGEASVKRLLDKGCKVYATARNADSLTALQQVGAVPVSMDVCDEESMTAGVQSIIDKEGRIDVLVNNAGYGFFGPIETVPIDDARRQVEVNVFGLARLIQLVLPYMRQQGCGRIINVASMAGHFCEPRGGWYHATKYAVVALSDCLRMETRSFGIKVSLIEPGAIRSKWSDKAMQNMESVTQGTVYEHGASRQAKLFRLCYAKYASTPDVIARCITHAATSRHPRIRYRKGFGSTFFILLNRIMPQRWFDALMYRVFG